MNKRLQMKPLHADSSGSVPSRDLFLSSEERYDVYCVKSSERPHLLPSYNNAGTSQEDSTDQEDGQLPLMDGCDIPCWRSEQLVPISPHIEAALNVGLGCPLLRRESQLPLPIPPTAPIGSPTTEKNTPWEKLRSFLMKQPVTKTVERISCVEASQWLYSTDDKESLLTTRRKLFSQWEEQNYPVIIRDCTNQGWNLPAWNYNNLVHQFGHVQWRFSDTHGAMMSLETYAKYVASEGIFDDSPLAVYDSEFGGPESPMHALVRDYEVPPCFSDDLFALATENNNQSLIDETKIDDMKQEKDSQSTRSGCSDSNRNHFTRPPWRWILMGPPRSGTGLHIDPLWTNAWVTLLEGIKRWVLIPPHLTSQLPQGAGLRDPQVPSVLWFRDYYQQVSQLKGVVEILQYPGETVFVPNGWPHLVLNLERTVAVTHNYASEFGPFETMWKQVAEDEPEFAQRWYQGLCQHRPDLASRIQGFHKKTWNDDINHLAS